jgi:peptide/nickel transport system ATP-binding protein
MSGLAVENLSVRLGEVTPVRDVSFSIVPGEILGLIGRSGSGKTMTSLAIARLLPERAKVGGVIRLADRDLGALDEAAFCGIRGREIGFVFQEPMTALNPVQTILTQVAETLICHGLASRKAAKRIAAETLAEVGLSDDRVSHGRYPHELSGGQRQRVAIAIAISAKPALLIADEPTSALDATIQVQILDLLKGLVARRHLAMLLVSHDFGAIARAATNVAVMQAGVIVETGPTAEILGAPAHPETASLIAATRLLGGPTQAEGARGPSLVAEGITRVYPGPRRGFFAPSAPVKAVDNISLYLGPGERLGIVGESGSGKSTLLRLLLGIEPPQAGRAAIGGESFAGASTALLRRLRRQIQFVPQDPGGSFDPRWRIDRIVGEPLGLLDAPPVGPERAGRIADLLTQVGLDPATASRYPHEFSGGQRQRIAIARALSIEPAILALDEVTSALDPTTKAAILDLLDALAARRGLGLIFVSHDLTAVRRLTDRVLVLRAGKVVEAGATERVFSAPTQAYTRELLAAASVTA